MTDMASVHRRAAEDFADTVDAVPDDKWHASTPCTEWDVRELVNHNVAENLWMPFTMSGATIAEVGDRFDGDVVGDDPAAACRAATEPAAAAVEEPGALESTVHLSFGDLPATEFVKQRVVDLVVHAWDVAEGAGLEWAPAADLVDLCLEWGEPWKPVLEAASDYFDPPIEPAPGADARTRLLNLFGRRPGTG